MNQLVLQNLSGLLRDSKRIYLLYLKDDQKFKYAKQLRSINLEMLAIVSNDSWTPGGYLANATADFVEHIDSWLRLWDCQVDLLSPKQEDRFVFEGYKKFPQHFERLVNDSCYAKTV